MKSKNIVMMAVAAGIIVAGASAAVVIGSGGANKSPKTEDQITLQLMSPSMPNAPALGSDEAKVTIVEFGDYQCTWCMRFHEATKEQLVNNYVDTGKVRFLFKDFPINDLSDRASSLAAEGSYCAADQGKYWEYYDKIYSTVAYLYNSNIEGENSGYMTKNFITESAKLSGVSDMAAFSECLESGKHTKVVSDNYNLARQIGLTGTPNFIILKEGMTPKLIPGAVPYSSFERAINEVYSS